MKLLILSFKNRDNYTLINSREIIQITLLIMYFLFSRLIGILNVNQIWLTTWLSVYVLKSDHKTDPSEEKICFVGWLVGLYYDMSRLYPRNRFGLGLSKFNPLLTNGSNSLIRGPQGFTMSSLWQNTNIFVCFICLMLDLDIRPLYFLGMIMLISLVCTLPQIRLRKGRVIFPGKGPMKHHYVLFMGKSWYFGSLP